MTHLGARLTSPATVLYGRPEFMVPDDLWGQCLVSGLRLTFGISAWKYNESVDQGEFRAKYYATGTQLASVDLRTEAEGGTFEHNGTTDLIITGLGATWEGFQYILNSADPGVWYYAGRLHNAAGWSVWSDGNPTPGYVKDRAETEDESFADTGPPADWEITVKEGPVAGKVVVSASRPQINGNTIIALAIQIKNTATGSWVAVDDSSPAYVIYDGSAIDHVYHKIGCNFNKASGNYGNAAEGDLILMDVRDSSEPGWSWDVKHCQWGTIPKDGIDPGPLHGTGIWNVPGFRPAFDPTNDLYSHIRLKIVRPPWEWATEGYLGAEPNRGLWAKVWWIPPDKGDKTTQTFVSDPIDLPVGLDVENVQARAWFENLYSRSDDDTYSGSGSGGGGSQGQGCIPISVVAGEVATNINLGSVFSVTSASAYTLLNPGGGTPYCGQVLLWMLSGAGAPTLDTKFRVMSGESILKSSGRDLLGAIYNAASDQWDTFFKRGG